MLDIMLCYTDGYDVQMLNLKGIYFKIIKHYGFMYGHDTYYVLYYK